MNIITELWHEIEHILGIAQAVAPIVAVNDPAAAASIAKAEAAVAAVSPIVASVTSASATPLTDAQKIDLATKAITVGANIAVKNGKISTQTDAIVTALAPAIAAAVAADKPVQAPADAIGQVRG